MERRKQLSKLRNSRRKFCWILGSEPDQMDSGGILKASLRIDVK